MTPRAAPPQIVPTPWGLVVLLAAMTAFGAMSIDMYLPALPEMAAALKAGPAAAQATVAVFYLGMGFGQLLYGPASDLWGRRPAILAGIAVYVAASLVCMAATGVEVLLAARLAQALGGCAGMVISRSVVRDLFDQRDSARMFSFLMLVMGIAPITAPLIGGQLLVAFGWRSIFWVLSGFGVLCLALVALGLPESLPPERRSRAGLGQALATYRHLLADRHFVGYALAGGLVSAGMFAYISGSPFVFIEIYGVAPERYGLIFGSNALGLILASQLNRWLLARHRGEAILGVTLAAGALASVTLVLVAATGVGGLPGLLVPLFVCIASGGLVGPNTAAAALAPHGRAAGSASALLGTLQFAVGAGAGALVGALSNGTAVPMAGVIAACAIGALAAFQTLAFRPLARAAEG